MFQKVLFAEEAAILFKKAEKLRRIASSIMLLSLFLSLFTFAFIVQRVRAPETTYLKAAIIDQLSSLEEFTNTTFVQVVNRTLTAAGYQVTYYNGSDVTVDFFQTLPTLGYNILIFRVYSALRLDYVTGNLTAPLDFFTSEPYSKNAHVEEQILDELDMVTYNVSSNNWYFGIEPSFVMDAMNGSFQNATVILEGCNGLDGQNRSMTMLQALVYRGARVVIGWNASVGVNHADTATLNLLHHLLVDNENVSEAINATDNEIGPDPLYVNQLAYYPPNVGNYTVPEFSRTLILPLFMIAIVLAVMLFKRKRNIEKQPQGAN